MFLFFLPLPVFLMSYLMSYSPPLVYASILMPVPHCFDCYSFIANLEVRTCKSFNFIHIFKIALTILSSLNSLYILGWVFHFYQKHHWSFDRDYINLLITLGSIVILPILSLLIHELKLSSDLFSSSEISLSNVFVVFITLGENGVMEGQIGSGNFSVDGRTLERLCTYLTRWAPCILSFFHSFICSFNKYLRGA
jgi:hypothetical protein